MKTALYIGIAGALGTMSRYLVGVSFQRLGLTRFPYATFTVNVLGAFLIGLCVTLFASRIDWGPRLSQVLIVGFLGGFTTYSAFALETVTLVQNKQILVALAYIAATLAIAATGCFVGMALARLLA